MCRRINHSYCLLPARIRCRSFFMSWSEWTFKSNTASDISLVYNSDRVVTLDEMPGWSNAPTPRPPAPTPVPPPPTPSPPSPTPPTPSTLVANPSGSPQSIADIICQDRPRSSCEVQLDVPSACTNVFSACPIVFFLHGAGGTINGLARRTGVHSAGYIGVYPQGERGWNTGPKNTNQCSWTEFDCMSDPNEGDYIADIIAYIRQKGAAGNVYVIGSSNGAALAHKLAANAGPDLPIKGIVAKVTQLLESPAQSGPGPFNDNQPRQGTPPVSVLSVMGTADPLIPYGGGSSNVFGGDNNFQLMSALDSMKTWASHNTCTGATNPSISTQRWTDRQGGSGEATKYSYSGCPDGVIVEHYGIVGGKHNAGGVSINGNNVDYVLAYDFINRVEGGGGGGPPSSPTPSPPNGPPPTPGPPGCQDDPSWVGRNNLNHDCDFVAGDSRRCNWTSADGVRARDACPAACNSNCGTTPTASPPNGPPPTPGPPGCQDDPSWAGRMSSRHDCGFIAGNPNRRCNWRSTSGVSARDACPEACDPSCNRRRTRLLRGH